MSMFSVNGVGLDRVAPVERFVRSGEAPESAVAQAKPPATVAAVAPTPVADLEAATAQIERFVRSAGRDLQFRIDDDSGRVVVSVRDSNTGELIRQIPSEETLRIAKSLEQGDVALDSLLIEVKA